MPAAALTLVLALMTMVGPLGIDTYLPSFHAIGAEFGVSQAVVQQTLSVYVGCLALMMLFYGTLSDSFGWRRVMLISLGLFTATSAIAALAPSAGALVMIRALQGLTAGAGIVIARAMVQDRFADRDAQRMLSLIMMVFGLAPALAPLIGGLLQTTLGWRANFVFLALFGLALLMAGGRVLPETLPPARRQPFRLRAIAGNYGAVLRDAHFLPMALSIALLFGGLPLYVGSAAAFVMDILHQPETAFGWLFLPLVGGLVSGSALASRLAHRLPLERIVAIGFGVIAAALALSLAYNLTQVAAVPWAVAPFGLYTFGVAMASPGMTVRTMEVFPSMRGLGSATQSFLQMMLFALVSGLLAPLLFDSALKLAVAHAVTVCAGMALWIVVAPRRARRVAARTASASAG